MIRTDKDVDWTENDPAQEFAELERALEEVMAEQKQAVLNAYYCLVSSFRILHRPIKAGWLAHRETIRDFEQAFKSIITPVQNIDDDEEAD